MAIQPTSIKLMRPTQESDAPSNGGIPSLTARVSGTKNAIFPDVSSDDRTDGAVTIRKSFFKVDADAVPVGSISTVFAFMRGIPDYQYEHSFMYGTDTDTQGSLNWSNALFIGVVTKVNTNQRYIEFKTKTPLNSASELVVFRKSAGAYVRIPDAAITTVTTHTYRVTNLDNTSLFSVNDVVCPYKVFAGGNEVGKEMQLDPRAHTLQVTSSAGTADLTQFFAAPYAMVRCSMVITFVTATSFNFTIPELGINGSGDKGSVLTVYHPEDTTQNPKHVIAGLAASFLGGTFSAGDRVTFKIESGNVPLWLRREVAAGQSALSGEQPFNLGLEYQSS